MFIMSTSTVFPSYKITGQVTKATDWGQCSGIAFHIDIGSCLGCSASNPSLWPAPSLWPRKAARMAQVLRPKHPDERPERHSWKTLLASKWPSWRHLGSFQKVKSKQDFYFVINQNQVNSNTCAKSWRSCCSRGTRCVRFKMDKNIFIYLIEINTDCFGWEYWASSVLS